MRTHKNNREFHIHLPRVHHLLGDETLLVYEYQVDKSLNKGDIPTIAGNQESK